MSLIKQLQIGDNDLGKYWKEYLLADYRLHTCRRYNEFRPDESQIYCECIELTVVAPGRDDVTMYEWFINQSVMSGRILITLPPQGVQEVEETKEVLFNNATCFSLEENYHINTKQRRMLKMSLVAEEVKVENNVFNRV